MGGTRNVKYAGGGEIVGEWAPPKVAYQVEYFKDWRIKKLRSHFDKGHPGTLRALEVP